jgi:chemotaxis methyl-accepting protein methylase
MRKKLLAQFICKDKSYSMDDQQFRQLLNLFGFSWKGYRKVRKGVKKRVNRNMKELGCRNMAAYLAELEKEDEARQHCELLLTVSISRFFRDREFWITLEKKLLPELITRKRTRIKVWSAGCACGDEVYSFKIVWDCLQKSFAHVPELEIIATDINPVYIDRARAGIYSSSSLKEVKEEFQFIYFKQKGGKKLYEVKASLGKDISWKIHHLLSDPPGSDFDIIFLRNNVLTYYEDRLKGEAFKKVLNSLAPNGLLIIGSHEELPFETEDLTGVAPHSFVFRKEKKL